MGKPALVLLTLVSNLTDLLTLLLLPKSNALLAPAALDEDDCAGAACDCANWLRLVVVEWREAGIGVFIDSRGLNENELSIACDRRS